MDIVDKITIIQRELNINQKELAEYLNISPQAISKILQRKSKPALDTITELCKLCYDKGISLEWFILDKASNEITTDEKRLLTAYREAKPEIRESAIILLEAGKDKQEKSCNLRTG